MGINPVFPIFGAVGALMILIGMFLLMRTRRFVATAITTTGEVVDMDESHDEGTSYCPIVRFTADDGSQIVFSDSVYSNPPMYKIGDEVKVLYAPENAQHARIGSPMRLHLATAIVGGIGAIFFLIGAFGMM
jgi:hypothetical protein